MTKSHTARIRNRERLTAFQEAIAQIAPPTTCLQRTKYHFTYNANPNIGTSPVEVYPTTLKVVGSENTYNAMSIEALLNLAHRISLEGA